METPSEIQEIMNTAEKLGVGALSGEDFRKLAAWDPYFALAGDPGRMTDEEFDLGVAEYPWLAAEAASWRLSAAQIKYCIWEAGRQMAESAPALIPDEMIDEFCETEPASLLMHLCHKLSDDQILACLESAPAEVTRWASGRLTDAQILECLNINDRNIEVAILTKCPNRIPRDRLLEIASKNFRTALDVSTFSPDGLFSFEELEPMIDDNLEVTIAGWPNLMKQEQIEKAAQLYPKRAVRLPLGVLTEEQLAAAIEAAPGAAIVKWFDKMTDSQIERAVREASYIPPDIIRELPDELFDLGMRTNPDAGFSFEDDRITPAQLFYIAENFPQAALRSLAYAPTSLLSQEDINLAFKTAAEADPCSALENRIDGLTDEQVYRFAHENPVHGLTCAAEQFTDEEYCKLAELYPNEAKYDHRRYYRLVKKFKRTTRGREAEKHLLAETNWTTGSFGRLEADEMEAAGENTEPGRLEKLALSGDPNVALAAAKNSNTSAETLWKLTYHPFGSIQDAALGNPNITLGALVDCAREIDPTSGKYRRRAGAWKLPENALLGKLEGIPEEDRPYVLSALIELPVEDVNFEAATKASRAVGGLSRGQKVALGNLLAKGGIAENFYQAVEVARETAAAKTTTKLGY